MKTALSSWWKISSNGAPMVVKTGRTPRVGLDARIWAPTCNTRLAASSEAGAWRRRPGGAFCGRSSKSPAETVARLLSSGRQPPTASSNTTIGPTRRVMAHSTAEGGKDGPEERAENSGPVGGCRENIGSSGCPFGFWRSVVPVGVPLGAVGQGAELHQGPHVFHLPARCRLFQPPVHQLLDGALDQPAADRLAPSQPQRIVQAALMPREVVQRLPQRRPVPARRQTAAQLAHPLRHPPVAVLQQTQAPRSASERASAVPSPNTRRAASATCSAP